MNGDGYSREGRGKGSRDYPRDRDDRRGDRDRHRDRRRSRSPYDRSSRRREDEDSYATSRSHREREREDRYSGRDRRGGDREWDRDRASTRRDARRDDDDRPRRDRDPYDDRRRGGGRDRNEDPGFGRRERQRSATPPPKKREPTPDLTDVTSVLERKRRLTQWDIKPPGYENVTAEQAKLSGMFPLPGAPRQQPMDPSKLQAIMNQPGGQVNSAALKPSNSRQAKRLLINNLPPSATEEGIQNFFNLQLNGLNIIESTDPCTSCQVSKDHSFAVVEFRNASEATVALALDGISMEAEDATNGAAADQGLVIRRPKDYIVPAVVDDVPYEPGVVSNVVVDTHNKISVANMPVYLSEEQVSELLVSFGELKAFVLVRDKSTEESRGIAFCEYVDPAATDVAIQGLNGMDLGDKRLKVQKASVGVTQVAGVEMGVAAMSMLAGTTSTDSEETRVLQLLNMVTPEELMDNDDYEEIKEDVQEECAKFGTVLDVKIPRPVGGSRQSAGVGKIFVKFETKEAAKKALQALAGRKFADRTVVTTYFPEENFEVGAW
ncbi:U2 snRNP auxilliary factor [Colletotrichum graminicola]|uniref:Splicing factor U2AF subunit n=1 Tax=Colletotrichum graminicola (strain M1.001 / M2 / FGSC 10212) TaxID=645133 RepID=E3QEX0_COLGM|nr:U2 snRNP auxilliary factor [Colletotrichum graminicola M1.001]EFQ29426.1 U2 snRNP auxilliary factor [Colletotrichum graminicola M1.001]WDK13921.1 U2 snRNP auxilliary factor [Colletotrichum graminicola]